MNLIASTFALVVMLFTLMDTGEKQRLLSIPTQ